MGNIMTSLYTSVCNMFYLLCRLEERLAQRRAQLAEKEAARQAAVKEGVKESERAQKELEQEKLKLKQVCLHFSTLRLDQQTPSVVYVDI